MTGVEFAPIDQGTDKLRLHEVVSPLPVRAPRPNTGSKQGMDSCLETGVIAAVRGVIVAAVGKLAIGPRQALFCLTQVDVGRIIHAITLPPRASSCCDWASCRAAAGWRNRFARASAGRRWRRSGKPSGASWKPSARRRWHACKEGLKRSGRGPDAAHQGREPGRAKG